MRKSVLPKLRSTEYDWLEGREALPLFVGCGIRRPGGKRAGSKSRPRPVRVIVLNRDATGPSAAQIAAYRHLTEHADQVERAVLAGIFEWYRASADRYREFLDEDEVDQIVPVLSSSDGLRDLIAFEGIYIHETDLRGAAHVGLGFECSWDEEHGLGVMTHKNRCVEVGGEDTAFLEWVAERDIKKQAKATRKTKTTSQRQTKRRHMSR